MKDADLPGLLREIDQWVEGLGATMRDLDERQVRSAGPEVVACVSGTGRLIGLDLAPRAMRDLDHRELAEAITLAIQEARQAAAIELTGAMAELTGEEGEPRTAEDPLAASIQALLREG